MRFLLSLLIPWTLQLDFGTRSEFEFIPGQNLKLRKKFLIHSHIDQKKRSKNQQFSIIYKSLSTDRSTLDQIRLFKIVTTDLTDQFVTI